MSDSVNPPDMLASQIQIAVLKKSRDAEKTAGRMMTELINDTTRLMERSSTRDRGQIIDVDA